MSYSPPKKATIILSFIIFLIGFIFGLIYIYEPDTIYDIFEDFIKDPEDFFKLFMTGCFILTLVSWLLLYLGVRVRGL
jgi:hypothetical protein